MMKVIYVAFFLLLSVAAQSKVTVKLRPIEITNSIPLKTYVDYYHEDINMTVPQIKLANLVIKSPDKDLEKKILEAIEKLSYDQMGDYMNNLKIFKKGVKKMKAVAKKKLCNRIFTNWVNKYPTSINNTALLKAIKAKGIKFHFKPTEIYFSVELNVVDVFGYNYKIYDDPSIDCKNK